MFGGLGRLSRRIDKIQWAAQAVKTPGHDQEHPGLRELRAMPRRRKEQDDREMAAIIDHLHQPRSLPSRSTRRDRFDGVTIDITPNP
jgi:hypothetical protein